MRTAVDERLTIAAISNAVLKLIGGSKPAHVLVTGPSATIAIERLDAIQDALPAWSIRRRSRIHGDEHIVLVDGTKITARSRRRPGYARGYSLDLVIIDDHTTPEQYAEVAPSVATTGGRLLRVE